MPKESIRLQLKERIDNTFKTIPIDKEYSEMLLNWNQKKNKYYGKFK